MIILKPFKVPIFNTGIGIKIDKTTLFHFFIYGLIPIFLVSLYRIIFYEFFIAVYVSDIMFSAIACLSTWTLSLGVEILQGYQFKWNTGNFFDPIELIISCSGSYLGFKFYENIWIFLGNLFEILFV